MIHKKSDSRARLSTGLFIFAVFFVTTRFREFLIKFDQKEGLILNICEEVMITYKIKDIGPAQPDCIWESFPGLMV